MLNQKTAMPNLRKKLSLKDKLYFIFTGKIKNCTLIEELEGPVTAVSLAKQVGSLQAKLNNAKVQHNLTKNILIKLVQEHDSWNEAIQKLIGRDPNWYPYTLERARQNTGMPMSKEAEERLATEHFKEMERITRRMVDNYKKTFAKKFCLDDYLVEFDIFADTMSCIWQLDNVYVYLSIDKDNYYHLYYTDNHMSTENREEKKWEGVGYEETIFPHFCIAMDLIKEAAKNASTK